MTGAPALVFGRAGVASNHSPASSEKRPLIFSSSTTEFARSSGLRTTATVPPISGRAVALGARNGDAARGVSLQKNKILRGRLGERARNIVNRAISRFRNRINTTGQHTPIGNEFAVAGNEEAVAVCT